MAGGVTRHYVNGIEYNGATIEFIQTEEGRAVNNSGTYSYEYYLKDHLGNTRAAVKQDGSIVQVQDYYAFGREMNPGNSYGPTDQAYKYNGKEIQPGIEQLDYGARFYDPVIGRWHVIDPLAEMGRRWSPYNYAFDNPTRFVDPDGMWPVWWRTLQFVLRHPVAAAAIGSVQKGATNISTNAARFSTRGNSRESDRSVLNEPKGMGNQESEVNAFRHVHSVIVFYPYLEGNIIL